MLLDAGLLTLIVGLIGGGRPGRLKDLDLRAPAVFILAAAVQVGLLVAAARGSGVGKGVGGGLHLATYALLVFGLWLNRHRWELRVAGVGVLMNLVVIAANGGSMPVDRELALRAGDARLVRLLDSPGYVQHKPMGPATRLAPLGDVLPLPMLVPRPRFFSPGSVGDVLITVGACWLMLTGLGAFGLGRARQEQRAA